MLHELKKKRGVCMSSSMSSSSSSICAGGKVRSSSQPRCMYEAPPDDEFPGSYIKPDNDKGCVRLGESTVSLIGLVILCN